MCNKSGSTETEWFAVNSIFTFPCCLCSLQLAVDLQWLELQSRWHLCLYKVCGNNDNKGMTNKSTVL